MEWLSNSDSACIEYENECIIRHPSLKGGSSFRETHMKGNMWRGEEEAIKVWPQYEHKALGTEANAGALPNNGFACTRNDICTVELYQQRPRT